MPSCWAYSSSHPGSPAGYHDTGRRPKHTRQRQKLEKCRYACPAWGLCLGVVRQPVLLQQLPSCALLERCTLAAVRASARFAAISHPSFLRARPPPYDRTTSVPSVLADTVLDPGTHSNHQRARNEHGKVCFQFITVPTAKDQRGSFFANSPLWPTMTSSTSACVPPSLQSAQRSGRTLLCRM